MAAAPSNPQLALANEEKRHYSYRQSSFEQLEFTDPTHPSAFGHNTKQRYKTFPVDNT